MQDFVVICVFVVWFAIGGDNVAVELEAGWFDVGGSNVSACVRLKGGGGVRRWH